MFIVSNIAAGGFNFWLGKGEIITLIGYQQNTEYTLRLAVILIPYFVLTEYIPSIVFVSTIRSFDKVINREPDV
jgi:hypothetical protein